MKPKNAPVPFVRSVSRFAPPSASRPVWVICLMRKLITSCQAKRSQITAEICDHTVPLAFNRQQFIPVRSRTNRLAHRPKVIYRPKAVCPNFFRRICTKGSAIMPCLSPHLRRVHRKMALPSEPKVRASAHQGGDPQGSEDGRSDGVHQLHRDFVG